MLASIYTAVTARGTLATVGIGIHGDSHAWLQSLGHVLANPDNLCSHLMTRHYGHLHHRVASTEGAEVTAAEAYIFHS